MIPRNSALDRLQDIEALTDVALSRLDEQQLLNVLLDRVKTILRADTAAVLLLDHARGQLVATAASGIEDEVRQGVRIPVGAGFAGRIAAERHPVILHQVDSTTVHNPLLADRGIRSLLGVPLLAGGKVIGVLHVGSVSDRWFGPEDAELLQLAADRAALAVQSIQSQDDRLAALALHRSLIPAGLPQVPGAQFAARYVTGTGNVGGDWYDVFILPGGELGMVIGDVAGSGLHAAVIMGRMRSALRAYALQTTDPGAVLRLLDRKIQYFERDAMATVLYAVYEPDTGRLTMSSAGHLPPVLLVPGEEPDVAGIAVDVPIGVADDHPRTSTVLEVAPGSLVCLYTDGLVERRDQSLDTGIGYLAAALGTVMKEPGPLPLAEEACIAVMRVLVGASAATDDVAVLMMHRPAVT
ncbi:MAG TPA: GAF domain-containing SpoIIE family protein phosphatase [Streptosporangiaceae bacterium]|nr:GAF domain-containing SpoIIE family protein phosphatase [Streptosporangiaceae bacterium]